MPRRDEGTSNREQCRRSVLTALAALSTGSVAGCLGEDGDTRQSPTPTPGGFGGDAVHIAIEGQPDVVGTVSEGELSLRTQPDHGTASIDGDDLRYDPGSGYNGYDQFQYESGGETATVRITTYTEATSEAPLVRLPRRSIQPEELGVVVNPHDDYSTAVADYYMEARGIPEENVVELPLPEAVGAHAVSLSEFVPKLETMLAELPDGIQGFALTWVTPFRVQPAEEYWDKFWDKDAIPWGIGITTAIAYADFLIQQVDDDYEGEYLVDHFDFSHYDTKTTRPYADLGIRPAMLLAMPSVEGAKTLIDRGVAADGTMPTGDGYLVGTDPSNLYTGRADAYARTAEYWGDNGPLTINHVSDPISDKQGVLLHMDGGPFNPPGWDSNEYRPGAVADHFTSFGGILSELNLGEGKHTQMSAMEWLIAGATASYGNTMEPGATPVRFPNPNVLLDHYYRGNTVLEAYWKSVQRPDFGVFIGEPLARPWGRSTLREADETVTIETTWLSPEATYTIDVRSDSEGDWSTAVDSISIDHHGRESIVIEDATEFSYRLRRSDGAAE
jgi:uncharacterized protein (TIGR03790 family)